MVNEFGSSESDEERHDRFRSERGQIHTAGGVVTNKNSSRLCSKCNYDSRLHCKCYNDRYSNSSQRSHRHRSKDRNVRSDSRRKTSSDDIGKTKRKCKREDRDNRSDKRDSQVCFSNSSPRQYDVSLKSDEEEKSFTLKTDTKENSLNRAHLKDNMVYGPGPPEKVKASDENSTSLSRLHTADKSLREDSYGPMLPSKTDLSGDECTFGPKLPAKRKSSEEISSYGPVLPSQIKSFSHKNCSSNETSDVSAVRNSPPSNHESLEDNIIYGPVLPSCPKKSKDSKVFSVNKFSSCDETLEKNLPVVPSADIALADIKPYRMSVSPPSHLSATIDLSSKEDSSQEMSDTYGPVMPSHKKSISKNKICESLPAGEKSLNNVSAPYLLLQKKTCEEINVYGPCLPSQKESSEEIDMYGPSLPPQKKPLNDNKLFGPSLPQGNISELVPASSLRDGGSAEDSENSDNDTFGPLPQGSSLTHAQILLERRAQLLREQALSKDQEKEEGKQREEWMLELPSKLGSGLGLQPAKSFRSRPVPAIDSSWTDTPAEKERKLALAQVEGSKKESKKEMKNLRDEQMAKYAKASNKRSQSSLLQLHQDKIAKDKKKAEKEGKKAERKPFSREDMGTPQLSKAQKSDIYKRAQQLDSRFSSGHSKYL